MVARTDQQRLTSKLTQTKMKRQPFGTLEDGTTVEEINGKTLTMAVDYMQEVIVRDVAASLAPDTSPQDRQEKIHQAQAKGLKRLVKMLNTAIPDERFHVKSDYILDDSNNYSVEFWLFAVDYCRVICGDPDFYANASKARIPPTIVKLFRPLSTPRIFQLLPQAVRKFAKADVRAVEVTPTSARMRWYAHRQDDSLLYELYLTISSLTYKNFFSSIPAQMHGRPAATVVETSSMLAGADYYEWIFSWQSDPTKHNRWILVGALGASLIFILHLGLGIPVPVLLGLTLLFPIVIGWSLDHFRRLEYDHNQKEILLQEQRGLADEQYDQGQAAKAQLQSLNVALSRKVDEFAALYEISVAINATLELNELIERSLRAVTTHLHFDRAIVLLVDEDRAALARGHSVGGSAGLQELVKEFEISLAETDNYFVKLLQADKPMLVRQTKQDKINEANDRLATAFNMPEHLGTPLISKGRRVGVLNVDNHLSKRPVTDKDAELVFVVAGQIAVAIENALLYREVEFQRQTLEERVAQRTKELAQATAEAQQARATAEEASEAKSAFLSNVSHELRTPLTSVLGFIKIIRRALNRHILPNVQANNPKIVRATDNIQESLQTISQEGERLTALINGVLDLAKIEAGKIEWEMQPLQITAVIEHARSTTTALFRQKGLPLSEEIEADLPDIIGDQDRLIQVMINLLSNACKFTAAGTVSCWARRDNDEIVVSVTDTGHGIAAVDLPTVFKAFKQVGDTLPKNASSSGLGLAICKEIIDYHGGRIWVESELGQGSTFSFAMPIYDREQRELVTIKRQALLDYLHLSPTLAVELEKPILIVDDEEAIRRYLAQELRAHSYRVIEAASGQEALELVAQEPPALIIMDILMPKMDGYKTLLAIRRHPAAMVVPVIVLSVLEEYSRGCGLGINQYMSKPIDVPALLSTIERLLRPDPASQSVIVIDGAPATELTNALFDQGYRPKRVTDLAAGLNGQPADLVLVSAALLDRGNPFDKPANRKALARGLVLVYA